MEWMIHASSCMLLTTVTGSILLLSWYFIGRRLEQFGFLDMLYRILKIVILFFVVPFVYILLYQVNNRYWLGNGALFAASPAIMFVCRTFLRVWFAGTLLMWTWYLLRNLYAAFYYRKTFRCSRQKEQMFEQLCKEIGIHTSRLRLCECYEAGSPFVMGVVKPTLFLPVESFEEDELKVILAHELTHYKQHDVIWKHIMLALLNLQWFNPFVWWLRWIVREWSEFACDFSACERVGGIRPYFSVIERIAERTSSRIRGTSLQLVKRHELERRILYVSRCKAAVRRSKPGAGIIILTLLLSSTAAVYSVSAAMTVGYITAFNETAASVQYTPRLAETEILGEYIAVDSGYLEASEITRGFAGSDRVDSGIFKWKLRGDAVMESSERYLEAGTNLAIHIFPQPSEHIVSIGLVTPAGKYRYIMGNGSFCHNFIISQSGYYKYFVQNWEDEPVTAEVYYTMIPELSSDTE